MLEVSRLQEAFRDDEGDVSAPVFGSQTGRWWLRYILNTPYLVLPGFTWLRPPMAALRPRPR